MAKHKPKKKASTKPSIKIADINRLGPGHLSSAQRARVKKLMANPGTRKLVGDKFLSTSQQKSRKLNTRLNAPITPGSDVTNRDLSHEADAAMKVKYGDSLSQAKALGPDQDSWYKSYLAELNQATTNQQQIGDAATTQIANLGNSVRNLDQTQLTEQQAAANTDAAKRGTVAGNLSQQGSEASTVRQALLASFGQQQVGTNAANNSYANNRAHVVGPGQQLTARNQARKSLADLTAKVGADNQLYRSQRIADEFKNVIAKATLLGNQASDAATAAATTKKIKETHRSNVAREGNAAADTAQRGAAALGKSQQDAQKLNKYGYTNTEWAGLSEGAKAKARKTGGRKGAATKPGAGPGSLNAGAEGKIVSNIQEVISLIKSSPKFDNNHRRLTDSAIRQHLLDGTSPLGKPLDRRIVNIAFDMARNGGLSPTNVKAAHDLNIHVGGHFKVAKPKKKVKTKGKSYFQKVG